MHDLIFIAFLGALFAMGLKRPFLLVLAYVYIDIVSPQRLTYVLLNTVPISLIAVVAAAGRSPTTRASGASRRASC